MARAAPGGPPWMLLVAVIAAVGTGCAGDPDVSRPATRHPVALEDTVWEVVEVGDRMVPRAALQLQLEPAAVSGVSLCNTFSGSFAYDPATGGIRFANVAATKRACLDAGFGTLEAAYFAALAGATEAALDGDDRLILAGTGPTLVLVPGPERGAPPAPARPAVSHGPPRPGDSPAP